MIIYDKIKIKYIFISPLKRGTLQTYLSVQSSSYTSRHDYWLDKSETGHLPISYRSYAMAVLSHGISSPTMRAMA